MTGINHEEDRKFGKIVDDWRCCDPSLIIYGENKEKRFIISGECCQCGLVCKGCEMCYEVKFFIYDGNCKEEDPKNAIGSIKRKKKDFVKAVFTDADSFDLYFPENATPYDKLMLIGATLMLDYTYFEDSSADNNRNSYNY